MNLLKKFVLVAALFALPFTALAWGVLGHRIVGEIANGYLTAKARAEIQKILGAETVALSSNWADFIKSDSTFDYLSPWHYVNLPKGMTRNELKAYLKADTATDLYTKMNFLIGELKKRSLPVEEKRMYLKLLVHFVGDAHQPMHTARREDLGGNRVRVMWFNNATNLHAVWDESLVNFQQLSYTEYTAAINHATLQQRRRWQAQPISDWIAESYAIAETLYPGITENNQKLSYDYNFKHIATVNAQLLKGGVRLAGVLNAIFG